MKGFLDTTRDDILVQAVEDCYRELYKACEPPQDYDDLVRRQNGGEEIDPNNYEVSFEIQEDIIEHFKYLYNISSKREEYSFNMAIYLGCGPKTKHDEEE